MTLAAHPFKPGANSALIVIGIRNCFIDEDPLSRGAAAGTRYAEAGMKAVYVWIATAASRVRSR